MNCPDCRNELIAIDFKGIRFYECVKCRGRWFDRDELKKAKDREDEDIRWLDFDPFGVDAVRFSVQSEGRECPACSRKMSSLSYSKSGVIIDKCPDCEGVWLGPGEFEKIIKYLENVILTESAKDYTKDTFKQFIEIFAGPGDAESEIKDFLAILHLLQLRIAAEHPKLTDTFQNIYKSIPFK